MKKWRHQPQRLTQPGAGQWGWRGEHLPSRLLGCSVSLHHGGNWASSSAQVLWRWICSLGPPAWPWWGTLGIHLHNKMDGVNILYLRAFWQKTAEMYTYIIKYILNVYLGWQCFLILKTGSNTRLHLQLQLYPHQVLQLQSKVSEIKCSLAKSRGGC